MGLQNVRDLAIPLSVYGITECSGTGDPSQRVYGITECSGSIDPSERVWDYRMFGIWRSLSACFVRARYIALQNVRDLAIPFSVFGLAECSGSIDPGTSGAET
ncbi:hypothetical protein QUF72_14695 [Desulfobacterales bacterium HSG2]|nr:hypothetical protein [Desulfobacterales bacterium HSG2]